MPYDETMKRRVATILDGAPELVGRKMFGGYCFMVQGHMCCGVDRHGLFVRLDPTDAERAIARRKHARAFAPTGKAMAGFVVVNADGLKDTRALRSWVEPALAWVLRQPPK